VLFAAQELTGLFGVSQGTDNAEAVHAPLKQQRGKMLTTGHHVFIGKLAHAYGGSLFTSTCPQLCRLDFLDPAKTNFCVCPLMADIQEHAGKLFQFLAACTNVMQRYPLCSFCRADAARLPHNRQLKHLNHSQFEDMSIVSLDMQRCEQVLLTPL
jgi:hypothetical protein